MNVPDLDAIPLDRPGDRLRAWRYCRNLTPRETARIFGVGPDVLRRIEDGEVRPEPELVELIGLLTDGSVLFHVDDQDREPCDGALNRLRDGGPSPGSPPSSAERGGAGTFGRMEPAPPIAAEALPARAAQMAVDMAGQAARARGPGRPGFALARHGGGVIGLVLIQDRSVTPLSRADAAGLRADLDLLEALLDQPLLFGGPDPSIDTMHRSGSSA